MLLIKEDNREKAENDMAIAVPVHQISHEDGRKTTLFVGNLTAASSAEILAQENITSTLNVSLNIIVPPVQLADGTHIRHAKVGLIDGPGNRAGHLAAAVLALHGLIYQASPGKPNYPSHRAGNVMVNCRGGRSRSVTVLALYLHLTAPALWPKLQDAIAHIRSLRGNASHYPLAPMIELAEALVADPSLGRLLNMGA